MVKRPRGIKSRENANKGLAQAYTALVAAVQNSIGRARSSNGRDIRVKGMYRHFKGGLYIVEGIAAHSETGEQMVVYRSLQGEPALWVRPLEMFASPVDKKKYPDATQEYRFELQNDLSAPDGASDKDAVDPKA